MKLRNVATGAVMLAVVTVFAAFAGAGSAHASGPQDEMTAANAIVQRAVSAAQAGDLPRAQREYSGYENSWFDIEDGVKAQSNDAYRVIEKRMSEASAALSSGNKDKAQAALQALDAEQQRFIKGQPAGELNPAVSSTATTAPTPTKSNSTATITALLLILTTSRDAASRGEYNKAATQFSTFDDTWVDVEGEVKTRSAGDYRATEDDMARVSTLLGDGSPDSVAALNGMIARLRPYENAGNYKIFDATTIIVREGLEAMLVVIALLAFMRKSGNADKERWVWGGATAGILASIALGVAIHLLFKEFFSGGNRELLEGITGLVAAVMLIYVSYWLHSQASLGAWQKQIRQRTDAALASGSLWGLAALAFLAVFREGGETVLFLIGMAGKISTSDLVLGLAIGAAFLSVVGVLLTVLGVRIPMRPFFAVASALTFYLCFKFVGVGIHALQVAGVIPVCPEAVSDCFAKQDRKDLVDGLCFVIRVTQLRVRPRKSRG